MWCFTCIITDVQFHVAQHVAIFTTTQYRTINDTASDIDFCFIDISPSVEESSGVTLTSSIEVASYGMGYYLITCTRNTESCISTKVDRTFSSRLIYNRLVIFILSVRTYIGLLITTIDRCQDMTACNIHIGITTNNTSRTMPFTWSIREVARTTTKHIAVEGMTIISSGTTTSGVETRCTCKLIVWSIFISTGCLTI